MSAKPELPSLDDELAPKRRVNLRAIPPQGADDAEVAENSRKLGAEWGAQTSLAAEGGAGQGAPAPEPKAALASLRIEVPEYLDHELARKAAELRVTKQFLVVTALQKAGYHVAASDLVEDKRKAKRKV